MKWDGLTEFQNVQAQDGEYSRCHPNMAINFLQIALWIAVTVQFLFSLLIFWNGQQDRLFILHSNDAFHFAIYINQMMQQQFFCIWMPKEIIWSLKLKIIYETVNFFLLLSSTFSIESQCTNASKGFSKQELNAGHLTQINFIYISFGNFFRLKYISMNTLFLFALSETDWGEIGVSRG